MRLDALNTVDVRFHHHIEAIFEHLNQIRMKPEGEHFLFERFFSSPTCSEWERCVCWRSLGSGKPDACREEWRSDRTNRPDTFPRISELISTFDRRFPESIRSPLEIEEGKNHK